MKKLLIIAVVLLFGACAYASMQMSMDMGMGGVGGVVTYESYNVWNGSAFESYKIWNGSSFEDYNVR